MKRLLNLFRKSKPKFPYIHEVVDSRFSNKIKFVINNSIEEFRLAFWGHEKEYVLSIIDSLKHDDIFLDIGSSVGLISILAKAKIKNGKVYSIEPDPENISCLIENYKINKFSEYQIFPIALGDKEDKLKLYTNGSNGKSPSLEMVNGYESFVIVDVKTLDHLIESNIIEFPTVIKIDIEGAELMALKGMKNLLQSTNKPRILFIEVHPEFLQSFQSNLEEVYNFLSNTRYKIIENIERDEQILLKLEAY
jgi:FkbM family methyltransferase